MLGDDVFGQSLLQPGLSKITGGFTEPGLIKEGMTNITGGFKELGLIGQLSDNLMDKYIKSQTPQVNVTNNDPTNTDYHKPKVGVTQNQPMDTGYKGVLKNLLEESIFNR